MGLQKYLLAAFFLFSLTHLHAQEALPPKPSPLSVVSCRYKDTYLKVTYSQPHKRGREIFGKLVPFGEVWRTGANEATEITITKEIFINKQLLPAGTYSLFTIPYADKWTIILNKEVGLWGSYNYNPLMDVMRFDVAPVAIAAPTVYEPFTIRIDQRNNMADIVLLWDRTKVAFTVQFIEPKQP